MHHLSNCFWRQLGTQQECRWTLDKEIFSVGLASQGIVPTLLGAAPSKILMPRTNPVLQMTLNQSDFPTAKAYEHKNKKEHLQKEFPLLSAEQVPKGGSSLLIQKKQNFSVLFPSRCFS